MPNPDRPQEQAPELEIRWMHRCSAYLDLLVRVSYIHSFMIPQLEEECSARKRTSVVVLLPAGSWLSCS